jgi:hypothetical protein
MRSLRLKLKYEGAPSTELASPVQVFQPSGVVFLRSLPILTPYGRNPTRLKIGQHNEQEYGLIGNSFSYGGRDR